MNKQKFISLSVPNLSGNEKKYVNEAIDSEWVSTAGPYVKNFEREMANFLNVDDAVACQSGTAGLHLALISMGINKNHEVIVPTLTFIAAVNPVRYVGAEPIFMDCDDSLCIDPIKVQEFIDENTYFDGSTLVNKLTNKIIKGMIAVHVFGNMCDMEKLTEISQRYNLVLIEDATEALGTRYTEKKYKGKFAGTIGDIGVYSFNGNKIITTGGGGMIISNNKQVLEYIRYLSTQAKDDEINFIHNQVGYNYRMTNIQAAIGVAQLEKLEEFIHIKKENYLFYHNFINKIEAAKLVDFRLGIAPNYWFYSVLIDENCKIEISEMISRLGSNNIQARPVWGLIHEQQPYLKNQSYRIEKAQYYGSRIINIPCSTNLSKEDIQYICGVIKAIMVINKE